MGEHYQPIHYPAHKGATTSLDPIDGELYLRVINYFMKKVRRLMFLFCWMDN
jgi:hypothetical protein